MSLIPTHPDFLLENFSEDPRSGLLTLFDIWSQPWGDKLLDLGRLLCSLVENANPFSMDDLMV